MCAPLDDADAELHYAAYIHSRYYYTMNRSFSYKRKEKLSFIDTMYAWLGIIIIHRISFIYMLYLCILYNLNNLNNLNDDDGDNNRHSTTWFHVHMLDDKHEMRLWYGQDIVNTQHKIYNMVLVWLLLSEINSDILFCSLNNNKMCKYMYYDDYMIWLYYYILCCVYNF